MTVPAGTERLADIVGPVAQRFQAAGFRLYLVGGVVRDLGLAAETALDSPAPVASVAGDIDLTTDAGPKDIRALVSPLAEALWTQGERFGTIGATVNGQAMEITTHRAEAYDPDSRKPVVTFGDDLAEDLSRRDFTVNAAAIEVPDLVLHDPYRGMEDLGRRVLRTPLSPEISFTDDPLRMLRASRFITRFGLIPTPELTAAATTLADRLAIVSVERVTDELERLLQTADPAAGLRFLVQTGLLDRVITPLADDRSGQEQAVALAAASGDRLVRRAGLLWPARAAASDELHRLRYAKADIRATTALLDATDQALSTPPSPSLVRRLVAKVGADGFDQTLTLAAAVSADGSQPTGNGSAVELAAQRHQLAETEDLNDLESPLTGADIIAILGIEPGPAVGRATAVLRNHRLDVGPLSADQATELLRTWWQEQQP